MVTSAPGTAEPRLITYFDDERAIEDLSRRAGGQTEGEQGTQQGEGGHADPRHCRSFQNPFTVAVKLAEA
jgi:hypothetical protein